MGLNAAQLRSFVVRPALQQIGKWSLAAENLVMGTAAQESRLTWLHQITGPAVGLWQIEPATYRDIWGNWLPHRAGLRDDLRIMAGAIETPDVNIMHGNLFFAAAMCRVYYLRIPEKLPDADDVPGMAAYWKRYYNTHLGRGTVAQFISSYKLVG